MCVHCGTSADSFANASVQHALSTEASIEMKQPHMQTKRIHQLMEPAASSEQKQIRVPRPKCHPQIWPKSNAALHYNIKPPASSSAFAKQPTYNHHLHRTVNEKTVSALARSGQFRQLRVLFISGERANCQLPSSFCGWTWQFVNPWNRSVCISTTIKQLTTLDKESHPNPSLPWTYPLITYGCGSKTPK